MPIYDVTYFLEDAYGRTARKSFEVVEADHPTAVLSAIDLATDLAALTELRILAYSVGIKVGYVDTAAAGANRDEGATFSVRKDNNEKDVVKVPGPLAAVRRDDGTIDVTLAAVTDFFDNFIGGTFTISDGESVTELLSGKLDK